MGEFKSEELIIKKPEQQTKEFIINISFYLFIWDWMALGLGRTKTYIYRITQKLIFDIMDIPVLYLSLTDFVT